MRYSLRTLLILTLIGPPLLAGAWAIRAGLIQVSGVIILLLGLAFILGIVTACVLLAFGY
jgi:hypothetical protein